MESSILTKDLVTKSSFILINRFGDIWFQDDHLLEIYEEAMPLYRKFFNGPRVLKNIDHFLI